MRNLNEEENGAISLEVEMTMQNIQNAIIAMCGSFDYRLLETPFQH